MKIVQVIQNNSGKRIDTSKDGKTNSCSTDLIGNNDNSTQPLIPSSNSNTGSVPKIDAVPASNSSINEIKEIGNSNNTNTGEEENKDNS